MTATPHTTERPAHIRDVMIPSPHSIGVDQTLETAHALMRKYNIRHLPVLRGGKLVGIVSSRDLYFIESLREVNPSNVTVEEAMSQVPYVVAPDTSLSEVVREMAANRYGSVVIMDGTHLAGIFTTTDGMQLLASML